MVYFNNREKSRSKSARKETLLYGNISDLAVVLASGKPNPVRRRGSGRATHSQLLEGKEADLFAE
jgi:hypothetical protein